MPFQFVNVSKDTVLAPSSRKLYRALLTKLSKQGFDTQQSLMDNSKEVIKYIEELYNTNRNKRVIVSAIFYILVDTEYIKSPNDYYQYFQGLKEPTYS